MTALLLNSVIAALPLIILTSLLVASVVLFFQALQVASVPLVVNRVFSRKAVIKNNNNNNASMPTGDFCHERR